jgi:hypothetical protein
VDIGLILVIVLSLWSITKTLEKLTGKILKKQDSQIKLLEEINDKLEKNTTKNENDGGLKN